MDDADQASDQEYFHRTLAVLERKGRFKPLPYIGYCYQCQEATEAAKNFCDLDCSRDYDRQEKLKNINGRKSLY